MSKRRRSPQAAPGAASQAPVAASQFNRVWQRLWPVALGLVAVAMLWQCWARSADVIVDYGREVYVPWQLAEGQVLYTDVAYFNGPFSPYWNAFWFAICGPSIRCLAIVNAVLVGVMLWLMWQLLSRIARGSVVAIALFVFVLAFAFGHYADIGNYNFIYPYSHEMTHGTALSLAALWCFANYLDVRRGAWAFGCGLFAGLTFLTKPEIFLALAAALGVGLAALTVLERDRRSALRMWGSFLAGAVVPPLVSIARLSLAMPPGEASRGLITGFVGLTNRELTLHPFYRKVMGNWDTTASLMSIGTWSALYLAVAALGYAVATRTTPATRWIAAAAVAIGTLAACAPFRDSLWRDGLYPLPVMMMLVAVWAAWQLWHTAPSSDALPRATLRLVWIVFALAMMLKIVLRVKVMHYGFALALPAAMTLILIVFDWLPRFIERRGGQAIVFQAAWLGPLVVFLVVCLQVDRLQFSAKTVRVAEGGDLMFGRGDRALAVQSALKDIERLVAPEQSLVVLPEGVTLNYLSRRVNPTPFINFMPAELILFGEGRMLEAFAAHPPDFIVLIPNNLTDMGYKSFAHDYALQIAAWVSDNYEPIERPAEDNQHHMVLLRRKNAAP